MFRISAQFLNPNTVIYNLCDGKLVCQIDLEPARFSSSISGGEDETPTSSLQWVTSPALDKLIWLDPHGTIFSLDLELYVRSKPQTVKLPDDFQGSRPQAGASQTGCTCRQGGLSWRQTLVDLHQQEIGRSANSPWSQHLLSVSPAQRKGGKPSRIPACGFRGKQGGGSAQGGLENYLKRLKFPSGSPLEVGYRVSELRCTKSTLAMVLVSSVDESQRAICLVDLKSEQVYFHK